MYQNSNVQRYLIFLCASEKLHTYKPTYHTNLLPPLRTLCIQYVHIFYVLYEYFFQTVCQIYFFVLCQMFIFYMYIEEIWGFRNLGQVIIYVFKNILT